MNTKHNTYQLTPYPIGSLREIWSVSWPIMLGLFSNSLMIFVDRIMLTHYSTKALNASANAGITVFGCSILFFCLAEVVEVFVGRLHGEGNLKKTARPVWQMLWFSLALLIIMPLGSRLTAPYIFAGTGLTDLETEYFVTLMDFTPFNIAAWSTIGFFVGTGRTSIVTWSIIIANITNIVLDYFFIFGTSIITPMGIRGAALATGISQLLQCVIVILIFLRKKLREKYNTHDFSFDFKLLKEVIVVGIPTGFGRLIELLSHIIYLRIILSAGHQEMTISTIVQTFFLLSTFIGDGLSKGVGAVSSNLIGANLAQYVRKVIFAGIRLQLLFSMIISVFCIFSLMPILHAVISESEAHFLSNDQFMSSLRTAIAFMIIFFTFDGASWVLMGALTAAKDTKIIFIASLIASWLFYIIPVYIVVTKLGGGAAEAWMIIAFYSAAVCSIYSWRFISGRWKNSLVIAVN